MIIYKCLLFGDELFSDAVRPKMDDLGVCLSFDTKFVNVKEGEIDGALLGANASAEEAQEDCEAEVKSGFDFVLANRLSEVTLESKKEFQRWCKSYFKKVSEKIASDDKKKSFMKDATEFCKHFGSKFDDLSFYGAPAHDLGDEVLNGNLVLVEWNEDGVSGKAYCLKSALEEEKV